MTKANDKKLQELVLYVSQKSDGDINFASVKLNKIIAFADMIHFLKTGKSITGSSYMKQPQGFVARSMMPALKQLEKNRELAIIPKEQFGRQYKIPTALRQADVSAFEATEIETVEEVLKGLKSRNNSEVSRLSHALTANWDYLPLNADIPISALLYPSEYILSEAEISHFKQLVRETSWGKDLTNARAAA